MRRLLLILPALVLLLNITPLARAADPVRIYVDGRVLVLPEAPTVVDGQVMAPYRSIFAGLGAVVSEDRSRGVIVAQLGDIRAELPLAQTLIAVVDAATALGDRAEVAADGKTVHIWTPPVPSFAELVQDVTAVGVVGVPGPMSVTHAGWVPVVATGDAKTGATAFAVARPLGWGRVIALGHEGILRDDTFHQWDNTLFIRNSLHWLSTRGSGRAAITGGHGEWVRTANAVQLEAELAHQGYTIETPAAPLTAAALAGYDVVIVGNAWNAITDEEVAALRQYVLGGGGLLLTGLGWSWAQAHPDQTLAEYPMNRLGSAFGVAWSTGYVTGPGSTGDGAFVFRNIYPGAGAGQ